MRSTGVLWRRTLRGIVIRPIGGDTILLGGSGPLVWDALENPVSVHELTSRLARETGADRDQIASDVRVALDELIRTGGALRIS